MPKDDSRAMPVGFYGDPSLLLERLQMNELGCSVCSKADRVLGKLMCVDKRNEKQVGVPGVGHRCKWFDERG